MIRRHVHEPQRDQLLDAITLDPWFDHYVRMFGTEGRLYIQPVDHGPDENGSLGWTHPRGSIDRRRAIAAHLLAGATGEPERLADNRSVEVNAIGLEAAPGDRVAYQNIDLDGGHPPRKVVASLRGLFGRDAIMVTSGSGRPGRFRALFRLASPLRFEDAKHMTETLIRIVGYPARKGFLEVYPSTNSRLPFGRGGCERFDMALEQSERRHPLELTETFARLPAVDLAGVFERAVRGGLVESSDVRVAASRVAGRPNQVVASTKAVALPNARRRLDRDAMSAEAESLWRDGVTGTGQRDAAYLTLALDCRHHGDTVDRAIARIQQWVEQGGIRGSARWRAIDARGPRELERELHDVARRIRTIYKRPWRGSPLPVRLTERETLAALRRGDECAAAHGLPAAAMCRFLLNVLPMFKGAARGSISTMRLHSDAWATSGGHDAARMRAASGLFTIVRPHRSRAQFGANARAASWSCSFPFDLTTPPPSRALVPTRGLAPARIWATAHALARRASRVSGQPRVAAKEIANHREHSYVPHAGRIGSGRTPLTDGGATRTRARSPATTGIVPKRP